MTSPRPSAWANLGADGSTLTDRLRRAGYTACTAAENVARGTLDYPQHRRHMDGQRGPPCQTSSIPASPSSGSRGTGDTWVLVLARALLKTKKGGPRNPPPEPPCPSPRRWRQFLDLSTIFPAVIQGIKSRAASRRPCSIWWASLFAADRLEAGLPHGAFLHPVAHETALLDVVEHRLHPRLGLLVRQDARGADVFAILGRVRDRVVHVGDAAPS